MSLSGAQTVEAVGRHCVRYGLVLVLLWIGGMKFTAYEAEGISGFVTNSPLMSWVYSVFSIRGFSSLLGVTEIVIGLLIAARPLSVRAALVGSALAVVMFLTTLSFLLTTPGVWEPSVGGFPAIRSPRTVPHQRRGLARRILVDARRSLAISSTTAQRSAKMNTASKPVVGSSVVSASR